MSRKASEQSCGLSAIFRSKVGATGGTQRRERSCPSGASASSVYALAASVRRDAVKIDRPSSLSRLTLPSYSIGQLLQGGLRGMGTRAHDRTAFRSLHLSTTHEQDWSITAAQPWNADSEPVSVAAGTDCR